MAELTDRDREILDFERQWWRYPAAKETAILEKFDLTATRYYQVLNALIDQPAAAAYDGQLVGRLRRIRDARAAQRSGQRSTRISADVPSS
ncbi:DUF3263 domain-containing protein [Nocardioides aquiterrae]|uniref:DUF3263 domain-containing protein n=1 Tax=Nocardioides aquiterrae TaxID=203799 RepID=A0ABN1UBV3_9ACTN